MREYFFHTDHSRMDVVPYFSLMTTAVGTIIIGGCLIQRNKYKFLGMKVTSIYAAILNFAM
jgi:hypothetical protein